MENFQHDPEVSVWDRVYGANDIDEKIKIFNENIINCITKPVCTFFSKQLPALWLTNDIKSMIKLRNKTKRTWRR